MHLCRSHVVQICESKACMRQIYLSYAYCHIFYSGKQAILSLLTEHSKSLTILRRGNKSQRGRVGGVVNTPTREVQQHFSVFFMYSWCEELGRLFIENFYFMQLHQTDTYAPNLHIVILSHM